MLVYCYLWIILVSSVSRLVVFCLCGRFLGFVVVLVGGFGVCFVDGVGFVYLLVDLVCFVCFVGIAVFLLVVFVVVCFGFLCWFGFVGFYWVHLYWG